MLNMIKDSEIQDLSYSGPSMNDIRIYRGLGRTIVGIIWFFLFGILSSIKIWESITSIARAPSTSIHEKVLC